MTYKTLCKGLLFLFLGYSNCLSAQNQTDTVDVPTLAGPDFPFEVSIELADWEFPDGLHSFAFAKQDGKWLFLAGRTNGLHGFSNTDDNFPPSRQNTNVYVADPQTKKIYSRSLNDPAAGLASWQVDLLSVTSPQSLQIGNKLYITGGYGVISETGEFSTKPFLTSVDVAGLIHWVTHPHSSETVSSLLKHVEDPYFQVTGGVMKKVGDNPILLIVGQNFTGYYTPESNGEYSQQIRRFRVHEECDHLRVEILDPIPLVQDPNLRRRDLNVVSIMQRSRNCRGFIPAIDILSGVFTPDVGIWTVPIRIEGDGEYFMADPSNPHTFKQAMNNYATANFGLFSKKTGEMHTVLMGGISFGYFEDGSFKTDDLFPFINQVTTVARQQDGRYEQFLLNAEYPFIPSQVVNPGNPLLFGAGSLFVLNDDIPKYINHVVKWDELTRCRKKKIFLGYIFGGIASTLPNINSRIDSFGSPYLFKVYLKPKHRDLRV